jgi:hypothetical protein
MTTMEKNTSTIEIEPSLLIWMIYTTLVTKIVVSLIKKTNSYLYRWKRGNGGEWGEWKWSPRDDVVAEEVNDDDSIAELERSFAGKKFKYD